MKTRELSEAQISLQVFSGYAEADTSIFEEFINPNARPERGYVVDFLGSRIRTSSLWKEARALDGQVIGLPVPGDFHAEAVEWIGLLKAVRGAEDQYVAMELGAGFGPWSVAGGLAAKHRGVKNIRLYAIEGDSQHFQFLRQHFTDNGFDPAEHVLLESAVGISPGFAQWPIAEDSSEDWGARPIHNGLDYAGRHRQKTKKIAVIPINDLLRRELVWDLVHIDVQGDEVILCRSAIEELNARARWIIVGTHSRKIDGDLLDLMCRAGWVLEHEKPSKFAFVPNPTSLEVMTTVDGTQVWRNPTLTQERDPLRSFCQDISSPVLEFRISPRDTRPIDIKVRNLGMESWIGEPGVRSVNVGYRWVDQQGCILPLEGNRAQLTRSIVRPGEIDEIKLRVTAPSTPGSYVLWISMVQEGVAWFFEKGAEPLHLRVTVE